LTTAAIGVTAAALLVTAAPVLTATPAGAVTGGFGVAEALRASPLRITESTGAVKRRPSTCDAGDLKTRTAAKTSKRDATKLMAPVACEQPPRSQFMSPEDLKHAVSAALAVLG